MKPGPQQSEEFYDIKILKNGTWLYGGTPINRHNLVKLFATVLKRDEKGDYWLETPYEKGRITVEDAPFIAVALTVESSGKDQRLTFRTNLDAEVTAGPDHPIRVEIDGMSGEPSPYIMVAKGLEARINRAVYYQLAELMVEHGQEKGLYGIWSQNHFYPLGRISP